MRFILYIGVFLLVSCDPGSGKPPPPAVAPPAPASSPIEGEYLCRIGALPNKLPEHVFRCAIGEDDNGGIRLRSLEDPETRISMVAASSGVFNLEGLIYIKERHLEKRYSQRWLELKGTLLPGEGETLMAGRPDAVVQTLPERTKGNRTDFRKGTSRPEGTRAGVEFSVYRR